MANFEKEIAEELNALDRKWRIRLIQNEGLSGHTCANMLAQSYSFATALLIATTTEALKRNIKVGDAPTVVKINDVVEQVKPILRRIRAAVESNLREIDRLERGGK